MGRPPGVKNGQGKKAAGRQAAETPAFHDQAAPPPATNVNPAIIAQALTEMLEFDTRMSSIAGLKGAAINRYEAQGVDRELLAALNKLGRKNPEEASAYITGLARYAVAAEVIKLADADWARSVKQSDMFAPATGDAADNLRMARANKQGFGAGRKGHAIESNPYSAKPGSPEFVGWRDGHQAGVHLRSQVKPGSENIQQAAATPQRRAGRKATASAVSEPTALEKDTAAYRAKGTADLKDLPPETDTIQ